MLSIILLLDIFGLILYLTVFTQVIKIEKEDVDGKFLMLGALSFFLGPLACILWGGMLLAWWGIRR